MAKNADAHTRGAVKDPEHDGRLKENRDSGSSKGATHSGGTHTEDNETRGRGAVKDPKHDGRLKENRGKRLHKDDT